MNTQPSRTSTNLQELQRQLFTKTVERAHDLGLSEVDAAFVAGQIEYPNSIPAAQRWLNNPAIIDEKIIETSHQNHITIHIPQGALP